MLRARNFNPRRQIAQVRGGTNASLQPRKPIREATVLYTRRSGDSVPNGSPLSPSISHSQPCPATLSAPPRSRNTTPLICNNRTRRQKRRATNGGGGRGRGSSGGTSCKVGSGSFGAKGGQKLRNTNQFNNQDSKSICSTSEGGERTTEECAEWAVAERASKSVSQANIQQPEWRRGGMAARDGAK